MSKHVEFFSHQNMLENLSFFRKNVSKHVEIFFQPKRVKTQRFLETVKQKQQQSCSYDRSTLLLAVKKKLCQNCTENYFQYSFGIFTSFMKTFCQICSLKTVMTLLFGLFSDMAFFTNVL